ncbi:unnamed protein product [Peronospora destructor]|uniref:Uncharacterized protein n=1 Tax=Peronospora destructor TaxID=86335 RepID=A0AAV0TR74_9STRA|nr:unnamed protein product [Peronospora destructor]
MKSKVKRFSQLDPLKTDNSSAVSSQSPLQSLGCLSETPACDYPEARAASKGDWRPTQGSGRHNSPLYGRHCKRPSSSSVGSNESEIATATLQQTSRLAPVSSSSSFLNGAIATGMSVQPLRTLQRSRSMHNKWEQGAAQQMRMELSSSRGSLSSQANSSEDVFTSTSSLIYDDKENGPRSCPSTFNDVNQHKVSLSKKRQPRGGELIVSKLQPTRNNVNNMLAYVHELQMSEASLRKELLKTKRHTEEELNQTLSKLSELQRTMQEVERDRKRSRRKLEKKEQHIRELAAKLERAEATQDKTRPCRRNVFSIDGLPRIAEEDTSHIETKALPIGQQVPPKEAKRLESLSETPAALRIEALLPLSEQNQLSEPILHPIETSKNESTQSAIISPRSPNRPLWDPWASGGAVPMKDLPPIFTIGSTGLDPEATPIVEYATTMVGDYELKSVLLSPCQGQDLLDDSRNVCPTQEENDQQQKYASPTLPLDQHEGVLFATLNSSSVLGTDSFPLCPPPPYSHQQNFSPPEKQDAAHEQMLQNMAILELSSQSDAMLHVEAMSPIQVSPNKQQDTDTAIHDSEFHVWNGFQDPQDVHMSAAWIATGNEDPSPTSVVGHLTDLPLQLPVQASPSDPFTQFNATGPSERFSSQPFPPSKIQPNRVASASRDMIEAVPTKPVSLETLLIDFFTEVDNKRLKMAKVYGMRYAGREKWLFTELSKRYGAAKVAALKARFENGSGGDASAVINHGKSSNDPHATNSSDVLAPPKAGHQSHPRHPQFVHLSTPVRIADLSAGAGVPSVVSSVAPFQEKDESRSQTRQVAEGVNTDSSPSKRTFANPILPPKRPTEGNIPSLSDPPPSSSTLQETGEGDNATAFGTDGATFRSGPARTARHGEPTRQFNQLLFRPQTENSNTALLGLRQRHQLSAQSQTNTGEERPAVTFEGLLKELYKTHQPDKLKNVSIVAKQYAGRERELVELLKGKYGVLSVKRLEENLDILELTHRAHTSDKGTRKKRGCFVRTVSLVFWLSVLLYISFGAVFVSFVVLDAWGCRSFDSEEQELEADDDCLPLKKELETFTYERIPTYMDESHLNACFCSEWKARESVLFDTFSGEDLVKLARLVPFSPESFGAPWIATVKEQVPSQYFYDSYAKPVVDLSLNIGLFLWYSVVELTGYAEVSEKFHVVKNAVNYHFGETAEVDNERFADNIDADVLPVEKTQVIEDEAVAVAPGLLEQVSVEKKLDTFDEKWKTDDLVTSDRATDMTDNVLAEDDVSEGMTTANEEGFSLLSETDREELAKTGVVNVLEPEDVAPVQAAESIDVGEQDSTNEAEAEETWTDASIPAEEAESVGGADDGASAFTETEVADIAVEYTLFNDNEETSEAESVVDTDDAVSTFIETEEKNVDFEYTLFNDIEEVSEAESVGGADDEASTFTETEGADDAVEYTLFDDNEETSEAEFASGTDDGVSALEEENVATEKASFDNIEAVAEAAMEVNEEMSAEDVIAVSEDVVEVEVRQDGLDLSYAESETDEALTAESAELSILSVDKESDPLFGGDVEPSALGEKKEVVNAQDASEDVFVGAAEEEFAPVMKGVNEDFATPTSSAIDADVEVMNFGSDIATSSEVFEIEAENDEREPAGFKVLQMKPSHALSSEIEFVTEASELPNITNIEELALNSVGEEIAASSLSEGRESKAGKGLDDLAEADAQVTETMSDEEERVQGDANALVAKDLEPCFSSSDIDAELILAEEGNVRSSNDGYMAIKKKSDDDHEQLVAFAEMEEPISDNGDEKMFEEKSKEADDEMVIPAEVSELEIEEEYVNGGDIVAPELTEYLKNQDYDLKESVEEASAVSAEIEAVDEWSNLLPEVEVENLEEIPNEMDKVGAESTAPNEIEVMQSVSEVDLVHELGEGSVAIFEDAIRSDDENIVYVEHAGEVNEHIDNAGSVSGCTSEGGEDVVADENEISVGPSHNDDDDDENEEIAFMLGLENPEELLRLAEQAAAATMETTETR